MDTSPKKKRCLHQGPVEAQWIAEQIVAHESKTDCGAHEIFCGQVRADVLAQGTVLAIEYEAYEEMAESCIQEIREEALARFALRCLHVRHSIGRVEAGRISLFVMCSSAHRVAAREACAYVVDEIKGRAAIWGKEVCDSGQARWKTSNNAADGQ